MTKFLFFKNVEPGILRPLHPFIQSVDGGVSTAAAAALRSIISMYEQTMLHVCLVQQQQQQQQ